MFGSNAPFGWGQDEGEPEVEGISLDDFLAMLAFEAVLKEAYQGNLSDKCSACNKSECPIRQAYAEGVEARKAETDRLN